MALLSSAAQQDDDVNEEQADEDEGEVDEQLLQVPLGLRIHLDLGRSADGRLGHVLDALHGGGGPVRFWWAVCWERREFSQAAGPVWTEGSWTEPG